MDPLRRLTKRQRLEQPVCWMDCETIATVVAPVVVSSSSSDHHHHHHLHNNNNNNTTISTPIASPLTEEIFLDRLTKEILVPFRFSLSNQIQLLDDNVVDDNCCSEAKSDTVSAAKERRRWIQSRLLVGLNACLRLLEATITTTETTTTTTLPLLVVLTSEAAAASTATAAYHVVAMLAHQTQTPLLVLPTTSARELGRRLGTKHVTALTFVVVDSHHPSQQQHQRVHDAIDSFVAFVRDKVVSGGTTT